MFKQVKAFCRYATKQNMRILYRTFVKSRLVLNPYILFYIGLYYDAMMQRDQRSLTNVLSKLEKYHIVVFLKAHCAYYHGDYHKAIKYAQNAYKFYPTHPETVYLLSKCLTKVGKQDLALDLLFQILKQTKRKKTWLYLSQTVSTSTQFQEFDQMFRETFTEIYDKGLLTYYSDAAIKVGEYQKAIILWRRATEYVKEKSIKKSLKKVYFSVDYAGQALTHLKTILDRANVPFFLISGTLLGCIRDNGILPHDKDLDVGVWEDSIDRDTLNRICELSGCFEVASNKDKLIKLKHINGTFIDIFIHYYKDGKVYHKTSKLFWWNKPFDLKTYTFLNQEFLIPNNYKEYLDENYGSTWTVPEPTFDSTFDTPNAVIASKAEMDVYIYRKIFESTLYNIPIGERYQRYIDQK